MPQVLKLQGRVAIRNVENAVNILRVSKDGQYLFARSKDYLTYYDQQPRLLWRGQVQGSLRHAVVGSGHDKVLAATNDVVFHFSSDGELFWMCLLKWQIQGLCLNGSDYYILVGKENSLARLDDKGRPIWEITLAAPLRASAIDASGQKVYIGVEGYGLMCLDQNGKILWTFDSGKTIAAIDVGGDVIVAGEAENTVYCLDVTGATICRHDGFSGRMVAVGVNQSGRHIVVGTTNELITFVLSEQGSISIRPRPKSDVGIANQLESIGAANVRNVFMNWDGDYFLVEEPDGYSCYSLNGTLAWRCSSSRLSLHIEEIRTQERRRQQEEEQQRRYEEQQRRPVCFITSACDG